MPEILLAIFVSVMASSGFWIFIQRLCDRKNVRMKILIGLGHDRIVYLGTKYLERDGGGGRIGHGWWWNYNGR